MKKMLIIALAAAMVFALAGCGAGSTEPEPSENEQSANPWTEAATADEAADGAGVGTFKVPDQGTMIGGGEVDLMTFRYMEGLAEADGYVGTAVLTVRKGLSQNGEDVSGDYTEYAYQWSQEEGGLDVRCFGNEEGKTMKAIWVSEDFSYSINVRGQGDIADTYGLSPEDIAALVEGIK